MFSLGGVASQRFSNAEIGYDVNRWIRDMSQLGVRVRYNGQTP